PAEIEIKRQLRDDVLWEKLADLGLNALCFSGGGIRNASFALGVTQGLAKCSYDSHGDVVTGLMTDLDYVSTVSGGGYTGSFLTRWSAPTEAEPDASFENTIRAIAQSRPNPQSDDPEPSPIRRLRSFTSYLAP